MKKKLISILCAVALLVTSIQFVGQNTQTDVKAADVTQPTVATLPYEPAEANAVYVEGMRHVTLENFGLTSGVFNNVNNYGTLKEMQGGEVANFDDTMLSLKVKFATGGANCRLQFAGSDVSSGFLLYIVSGTQLVLTNTCGALASGYSGDLIKSFASTTAGVTSFHNNEFLLQISFEYEDVNEDGRDDLTMGFYFNGKLYEGQKVTFTDVNNATGNSLFIYGGTTASTAVTVHSVAAENTDLTLTTWSDFKDTSGNAAPSQTYTSGSSTSANVQMYTLDNSVHESVAGTRFRANMMFSHKNPNTRIYYGGTGQWNGFCVEMDGSGRIGLWTPTAATGGVNLGIGTVASAFVFDAVTAGVGTTISFDGLEFDFQISTEMADYDGDGDVNDVQIGFYFNEKLYNNMYMYAYDCASAFGSKAVVHIQPNSGEAGILIHSLPWPAAINIPGMKHATLENFGLSDIDLAGPSNYKIGTYKDYLGNAIANYDNTLLSIKLNMAASTASTGRIEFAGAPSFAQGFLLYCFNNSTMIMSNVGGALTGTYTWNQIKTFNAATAGLHSFTDEDFVLQISFDYNDTDSNGTLDALTMGFYFNGKLYGNQKLTFADVNVEKIGNGLNVVSYGEADHVAASSVAPVNPNLTATTWSDFETVQKDSAGNGYAASNQTFNYTSAGAYREHTLSSAVKNSVLDTCFQARVKFTDESYLTRIQYGGTGTYDGVNLHLTGAALGLWTQNTDIGITSTLNTVTFDATTAGLGTTTFKDVEFDLKITMEQGDFDGDGDVNDVQIGFYFNDKLYKNMYHYAYDAASNLGNRLNVFIKAGSDATDNIMIHSLDEDGEETPEVLPTDLTKVTFKDYNITDGAYVTNGASQAVTSAGAYTGTATDLYQSVFAGEVYFSKTASGKSELCLNGRANWNGLRLASNADGSLTLYEPVTQATVWPKKTFTPTIANTKLVGQAFNLKVTMEAVNNDGSGGMNDLKVGVWFNGKLYDNEYIYYNNYVNYGETNSNTVGLGNVISILGISGETVRIASDRSELPQTEEVYNLAIGNYLVSGEGTITVGKDGIVSTYTAADNKALTKPGAYKITTGDGIYKRQIFLYHAQDAHLDDGETVKIDSRDLVAIIKAANGTELDNRMEQMGADANGDGTINNLDINSIRDTLVGISEGNGNTAISYEENVMPIGGFHGPYATNTSSGLLNLANDTTYSLIKESGVDLITHIPMDYSTTGQEKYLEWNLYLAEKYGIGIYLDDTNVVANATEDSLVTDIQKYSQFRSFKGLRMVDEPSTDYYGVTGGKLLSTYANAASLLNKFTNLIGVSNPWGKGAERNLTTVDGYTGTVLTTDEAYDKYLNEYLSTYGARQITTCNYVWGAGVDSQDKWLSQFARSTNYFTQLSALREKSLEKDVPFSVIVQAGSNFNTANVPMNNTKDRTIVEKGPNQAQMLWNVNTSLAYGAKGIDYFPLVQPRYFAETAKDGDVNNVEYDFNRNGLIGADGNKTIWYDYAVQANQQIRTVDEVLMRATSKAVLAEGGCAKAETGITTNDYSKVQLASITVATGTGVEAYKNPYREWFDEYEDVSCGHDEYGAIVGVFDYQGKEAYYVVNYDYKTERAVTLNFDASQSYEVIATADNCTSTLGPSSGESCTLNLTAGGAALVVLK